ncbi:Gene 25-like lysozyme [Caballeronia arationis]|uniref:GPW/gp25 family protein n=1 Tax=Caballeronia arationis TaxID=1777142 RepID=UPI00074BE194|nr:GPW/gp25 family protein [Caballeronia arationis]SAK96305.1 Gene 25-like lysozyme [Caballeronia arationis]
MNGPVLTGGKSAQPQVAVGWPLLPVPDASGTLVWPDAAASVKQMIEVILRTTPGEQLMRPQFGAGTEALVWQPNTLAVRTQAREAILAALEDFEPRIVIDRVDVEAGADPRELLVTIAYRLALTGVAAQLSALVPVGAG